MQKEAQEAGEVVAKVYACGSGLTIQHFKAGRVPAVFPRIIGHEICAEVVEVGAGVDGLEIGDIVTSYFYMCCGRCKHCRANFQPLCENFKGFVGREIDGGYAEYVKLPERWFIKLPDGLDWQNQPAHVGVAMDALATPYKVLRRARIKSGETVAVMGDGSFAMEWLFAGDGGTETFTLQAFEGGGDTYNVIDAQITVEVVQDTRCEGLVVIIPPSLPDLTPDDIG